MAKYKFPDGFLWGSGTAARQIEGSSDKGGRTPDGFDLAYADTPYRFFDGKDTANDFYNRYKEDIKIAKNLNMNSIRWSISWSRLLPDGKTLNKEAVKFYRDVFAETIKAGMTPSVCLFHFDTPEFILKKDGWSNRNVVNKFEHFAKVAFKEFGDQIKNWWTFNEAEVTSSDGYLLNLHPPFELSMKKCMKAVWNIVLAHSKAVLAFRKGKYEGEIGFVMNVNPGIPRSQSPADIQASEYYELFQWRQYLAPIINGVWPEKIKKLQKKYDWMHEEKKGDMELIKKAKIDILGINFYRPTRIKALPYKADLNCSSFIPKGYLFETYDLPGKRMNKYRGWEIHPQSIYMMVKMIQNEFGNIKSMICENGMGVEAESRFRNKKGFVEDIYRIEFLSEHLYWLHKAVSEGANLIGFHMWTYIDNWSWINAYKNRYGYIELDLETGKRIPKRSAEWISNVHKTNEVEWPVNDKWMKLKIGE